MTFIDHPYVEMSVSIEFLKYMYKHTIIISDYVIHEKFIILL